MNDITLNRKRIGRFIPEKIKINKDRAYTREETSKILDFCDIRSTIPNNDYVWQYHIQNLGNRWSPPPVTTTQPNSPSS